MHSLIQIYKYAGDANTSVYLNARTLGIVPQGTVQYGLDKRGKLTIVKLVEQNTNMNEQPDETMDQDDLQT